MEIVPSQRSKWMKKILVIEDEDSIREDILEILCGGAFEAIGAENGIVGVKLAKLHKPDLIICDVMMPELDGHSVLRALRSETSTAMIPFIFLTAKADKTDIRRGMNLGADDYLSKPIGQADLLEAIATRLNKQSVVELHLQNSLKETQDRLDYVVYHDSLTNLPNRLSLRARLDEILEQADSEQILISILLIDIDRFKRVNDVKGHKFGDALLKALAERLLGCVADDVVARMDADEFAIILNATDPKGEADYMAQTILNELMRSFTIDDQEVYITASIGISLYPQDGRDIDTLFKHVNLAMYRAKKLGGNCYEFYTNALNESNPSQLALESSLHHALERHEFQVYYQPQIDLRTGIIVGAEALVRWYHPQMGILSPDKFIPLAEENGAIVSIGEWILVTACQQAKVWHEINVGSGGGNYKNNHLKVAVNLSGRQFQQPTLATKIVRLIEETELDPSCLELELTEGVIIRDVEASITKMNDLKAIGVQISIDDFGTGYSSLSYLKQFPFDTLKIDQCFIRNMASDSKNQAIAIAIIQMAHSLDLKVIAEGVETKAEVEMLCQHHCDEIQGYVFSRPLPAEEFTRLLASDRRLPI